MLFIILIAVALFAALSYAVTQSSRSGSGDTSKETQKLDQAVIDNHFACINQGQMRLTIAGGCNTINYDPPSAWSGSDFDCHMFHPQGGGCAYTDLGDGCANQGGDLTTLAIGEECVGIVYAGESGANRIYTTLTDQTSTTWNNGTNNSTVTGATSVSDGLANTNTLLSSPVSSDAGAPYQAAQTCRALGSDWYLPAKNELDLFADNKDEGALSGTFDESDTYYWSSSENNLNRAWLQRASDGNQTASGKDTTRAVRCARR